jgi:hypothetical protein
MRKMAITMKDIMDNISSRAEEKRVERGLAS